MTLEVELDTGPVHLERRVAIGDKTLDELMEELANVGASALIEVLGSPELLAHPTPQLGEVTYADEAVEGGLSPEPVDASAVQLLRTVRLGRAFAFVEGRRLLVEVAALNDDDVVAPGALSLRRGRRRVGNDRRRNHARARATGKCEIHERTGVVDWVRGLRGASCDGREQLAHE